MGNSPDYWRLGLDRHKVHRRLVGVCALRVAFPSPLGDRTDGRVCRTLHRSVLVCPALNCHGLELV